MKKRILFGNLKVQTNVGHRKTEKPIYQIAKKMVWTDGELQSDFLLLGISKELKIKDLSKLKVIEVSEITEHVGFTIK